MQALDISGNSWEASLDFGPSPPPLLDLCLNVHDAARSSAALAALAPSLTRLYLNGTWGSRNAWIDALGALQALPRLQQLACWSVVPGGIEEAQEYRVLIAERPHLALKAERERGLQVTLCSWEEAYD